MPVRMVASQACEAYCMPQRCTEIPLLACLTETQQAVCPSSHFTPGTRSPCFQTASMMLCGGTCNLRCVQEREIMQRFGFLYGGYSFQYWETVDMMRKLLIGAIPVFVAVQPQGSLQAVIGQVGSHTAHIPHHILILCVRLQSHTDRYFAAWLCTALMASAALLLMRRSFDVIRAATDLATTRLALSSP